MFLANEEFAIDERVKETLGNFRSFITLAYVRSARTSHHNFELLIIFLFGVVVLGGFRPTTANVNKPKRTR
jgi:hypothetical protein